MEGNGGYNEPSAAFQAQCDVTLGGSRSFCDQRWPNPFFGVHRIRGHDTLHEPDALALRAGAAVPRVRRLQPEPAEPGHDAVRLDAVRGEQAVGEGRDHQRQLHVGAAVDRRRAPTPRPASATPTSTRSRSCEHRSLLLAPRTPHHRVGRVGAAVVPRPEEHRWLPARRLVDRASLRLPVRPAVGHARQRRSGAGHRSRRTSRSPGDKDGPVHLRREAVHRPAQRERRAAYDLLSVSTAYGCTEPYFLIREAFQRRTAMFRYDEFRRPGFWQVDVNFAKTTPITDKSGSRSVSRRSTSSTARCTTSGTTTTTRRRRTSAASTATVTGQSNFQRFVQLGIPADF